MIARKGREGLRKFKDGSSSLCQFELKYMFHTASSQKFCKKFSFFVE